MPSTALDDTVALLKEKRLRLATAESLTGGGIAQRITDVSGASEVTGPSFVVYSNLAKHNELGVSWDILNEFTAVSQQTAHAMVRGIFNKVSPETYGDEAADIAVAVTGYASDPGALSPNGAADTGLVYIGIGTHFDRAAGEPKIDVYQHRFQGDRDAVREQTLDQAIAYVLEGVG